MNLLNKSLKKMNKNESRYFYTASLMNEALLYLLEKKDFDFITIKEICQKAGVNRSTFYLHYQNMNDLLEETIENLNKKFIESFPKDVSLEKAINEDLILTREKYLTPYLKFIKENKRIFMVIVNKKATFKSEDTFKRMYKHIFTPIINYFDVKEEEKEYILEFYTKGVLAIIFKWIERDCPDEETLIIDLITRLTKKYD